MTFNIKLNYDDEDNLKMFQSTPIPTPTRTPTYTPVPAPSPTITLTPSQVCDE